MKKVGDSQGSVVDDGFMFKFGFDKSGYRIAADCGRKTGSDEMIVSLQEGRGCARVA